MMATIRCDGEEIGSGSRGSIDDQIDLTFRAPFVMPMVPRECTRLFRPEHAQQQERGEYLCEASSPLYSQLIGLMGRERAGEIMDSLPAGANVVTIRDEYLY
jgi:hypothetical protein